MNSSAPPSLPPAHFAASTSVRGGIPIVFVKPRSLRVIGRMRDFEHGVRGIAASSGEADQGGVALSCRRHVFRSKWARLLGSCKAAKSERNSARWSLLFPDLTVCSPLIEVPGRRVTGAMKFVQRIIILRNGIHRLKQCIGA